MLEINLARYGDDMTLEDVVAAIGEAENRIDAAFATRAVRGIVKFVFVAPEKTLSEKEFFSLVAEKFPGAAGALRRLIEKYASDDRNRDLYYEDGTVALGHAALALARLDASAAPVLRRYGAVIDGEHEGFYPLTILPTFFKTHGWTDAAIELGMAEMIVNGSPYFYEYKLIWRDWGMGDAVASAMAPQDFAARLLALARTTPHFADDDMYGFFSKFPARNGGLSKTAPAGWMPSFFGAIEEALPDVELDAELD
jgi:hypothetical protein